MKELNLCLVLLKAKWNHQKHKGKSFKKTNVKLTLLKVLKVIRSLNMLELNGMFKTQSFKGLYNVWNMPKGLLQNQNNLLLRRKNALSWSKYHTLDLKIGSKARTLKIIKHHSTLHSFFVNGGGNILIFFPPKTYTTPHNKAKRTFVGLLINLCSIYNHFFIVAWYCGGFIHLHVPPLVHRFHMQCLQCAQIHHVACIFTLNGVRTWVSNW